MAKTIWVLADLHGNTQALKLILETLVIRQRDYCIFLGNLMGHSSTSLAALGVYDIMARRHTGRCFWLAGEVETGLAGKTATSAETRALALAAPLNWARRKRLSSLGASAMVGPVRFVHAGDKPLSGGMSRRLLEEGNWPLLTVIGGPHRAELWQRRVYSMKKWHRRDQEVIRRVSARIEGGWDECYEYKLSSVHVHWIAAAGSAGRPLDEDRLSVLEVQIVEGSKMPISLRWHSLELDRQAAASPVRRNAVRVALGVE
jgi:hypothetical protein